MHWRTHLKLDTSLSPSLCSKKKHQHFLLGINYRSPRPKPLRVNLVESIIVYPYHSQIIQEICRDKCAKVRVLWKETYHIIRHGNMIRPPVVCDVQLSSGRTWNLDISDSGVFIKISFTDVIFQMLNEKGLSGQDCIVHYHDCTIFTHWQCLRFLIDDWF